MKFPKLGIFLACLLLLAGIIVITANAKDKPQTLTGEISDTMCGAQHMMSGGAAQCTKACVSKGSKYALVVGDKVYTLEGGDTATLEKMAGQKAKVTGTVKGETVEVSSVTAP